MILPTYKLQGWVRERERERERERGVLRETEEMGRRERERRVLNFFFFVMASSFTRGY
jgi:hypothetical protein